MRKQDWLASLKPGDAVAITGSRSLTSGSRKGTVKAVTPTGRIRLEDGKEFNPDGRERGRSSAFSYHYLEPWTEEVATRVERNALITKIERLYHRRQLGDYPIEALRRIGTVIDDVETAKRAEAKGIPAQPEKE